METTNLSGETSLSTGVLRDLKQLTAVGEGNVSRGNSFGGDVACTAGRSLQRLCLQQHFLFCLKLLASIRDRHPPCKESLGRDIRPIFHDGQHQSLHSVI